MIPFGSFIFQDLPLSRLSPNLPEPPSPNTVPFGQSKSGWGDSVPECAHFLAVRAHLPALLEQSGPALADVFLVPA